MTEATSRKLCTCSFWVYWDKGGEDRAICMHWGHEPYCPCWSPRGQGEVADEPEQRSDAR